MYRFYLTCMTFFISFLSINTGSVKVGCFTYEWWSSRVGMPIVGMTFHCLDCHWQLKSSPLHFSSTIDIWKYANEHRAILRSALRNNDRVGPEVLVLLGRRIVSQTLSLVWTNTEMFLDQCAASYILCILRLMSLWCWVSLWISAWKNKRDHECLHRHKDVRTKLVHIQCQEYTKHRTVFLHYPFNTCWHSKLSILEKYIVKRPYHERLLPSDAPPLPEISNGNGATISKTYVNSCCHSVAACIDVIFDDWRVARWLEKDCSVYASCAALILSALYDTLGIMSSNGRKGAKRLISIPISRMSAAKDDKTRDKVRERLVDGDDARLLAKNICDFIHHRLGHLYKPFPEYLAMID